MALWHLQDLVDKTYFGISSGAEIVERSPDTRLTERN